MPFDLSTLRVDPQYDPIEPDPADSGRTVLERLMDRILTPEQRGRVRNMGKPQKSESVGITQEDFQASMQKAAQFVQENAPSVLRLSRLALYGDYSPPQRAVTENAEGPMEEIGGALKNAAISIDELIPSILSLPFQFMADPGETTRALVYYAPEQVVNLVQADLPGMFEHLHQDKNSEYWQQRDEARKKLYEDPMGPVFAFQLLKSLGGTPKAKIAARTKAKVALDTETASLLSESDLGPLSHGPEPISVPRPRTLKSAESKMVERNRQIPPEEHPPIPADVEMPTVKLSWWRNAIAPVSRNAATAKLARMQKERIGRMHEERFAVDRLVKEGEAIFKQDGLTTSQIEDLKFYRERTSDPRKKGGNPERDLPDRSKQFVDEQVEGFLQRQWDDIVESGLLEEQSQIAQYLDHFWEGSKESKGQWAKRIRKNRKLPTYADGIKAGLKPRYENILDIVRTGHEMKARVIANNEFITGLFEMMDADGNRFVLPQGAKGAKEAEAAGWQKVDHPSLNRLVFRKAKGSKAAVGTERPVLVHPDFAGPIENLFREPFMSGNKFFRGVRTINAYAKASQLGLSFFHFGALTESAFGAIGPTGPFKFRAGLKLTENPSFIKDAVRNGLDLAPSSDVGLSIVNRGLRKMEANARGRMIVGPATRFLRAFKDGWDKALWDNYHRGLKAYAYYRLKGKMMEKYPEIHERVIGETSAELVNNFFGGQNFEAMLMNPHMLEVAHLAFLAPDWTLSVAKQAGNLFEFQKLGEMRAKLGRVADGDLVVEAGQRAKIRGAAGRRYWARYALYNYIGLQMLNLFFTGLDGDPHFTWDNPDGHKLDFRAMGKHKDGSDMYARPSKQAREVIRWLTDPVLQMGSKTSPVMRGAVEQLAGAETGSGFPAPWKRTTKERITGIRPSFWETMPLRLRSASEMFVPFSFSGTNFAATFPVVPGMTRDRFRQEYGRAFENRDYKRMSDLIRSAQYNELKGWQDIVKHIESRFKALSTIQAKERVSR